jgi:hypothetical protein
MNAPTPETDAHMLGGSYSFDVEFARRLERERDESRKLLRDANRGAERNAHISQSLASQLVESRRERDEARAEAAHWKSNHDNQVAIKSALIQRPDLGDRAQRIATLIKERDESRAKHAADVAELNQRLIDRHTDMMATIVELRNKLTELQRQLP